MTIEQIKEEAKKRFNKDITDEQAQAILENYCSGELSAQILEKVTGGAHYKLRINFSEEARAQLAAKHKELLDALLKGWLDARSSEEMSDQELVNVAGGGYYQLDTQQGTIKILSLIHI